MMIKIFISVVVSGAMAIVLPITAIGEVSEVDHQAIKQSIQIKEVSSEPKQKDKKPDIVKDNPNNCDHATEWIWSDGTCHTKDVKPVEQPPSVARSTVAVTGDWVANCHAWAAQAGVSLNAAAIELISRESKCDPTICNPNGIACGIPQALPWTKMGCSLSVADAPCQIKWFEQYVVNRYGSYSAALAHSQAHNWY